MPDRAQEAARLRSQGLSYREIGEALGLSKQRAWQLVNGRPERAQPGPGKRCLHGPAADRLWALAASLDMSPESLVDLLCDQSGL